MGLEKIGTTFVKQISAYVKSSRCKSILTTKPAVGKINFEGLKLRPLLNDTVSLNKGCSIDLSSKIQALLPEGTSSETFKKLFSQEFKPLRRVDENGYFVTTVINRNTKKPQEIFIQKIKEGKYNIFTKNAKGEYEVIGTRSYELNPELKQIDPGWMTSHANKEFSGIGIRCHQLAVEDAIRHNYNNITLSSLDDALKFHEKALFVKTDKIKISKEYFNEFLETVSQHLGMPQSKVEKFIPFKIIGNNVAIELNKAVENINKAAQQCGKSMIENSTVLKLDGERLELWKQLAMSQPITL